jgi:hypothetical protein
MIDCGQVFASNVLDTAYKLCFVRLNVPNAYKKNYDTKSDISLPTIDKFRVTDTLY